MPRLLGALTGKLWGIACLWLMALMLCLAGWALFTGSGAGQSERVERAVEVASAELGPSLQQSGSSLAPQLRALLANERASYAWLRLRDRQGHAIASAGVLDGWDGFLVSSGLRRQIYKLISTEYKAPLIYGGQEQGTIEFGLMVSASGLSSADSGVILGLLALGMGLPLLLLLSARLKQSFQAEWVSASPGKIHAVVAQPLSLRAQSQPSASLSPAANELMAIFDRGGVVVDREQIVRDINLQAEKILGYSREQARGQPLKKLLDLYKTDTQEPTELDIDACLRGILQRIHGRYQLRDAKGVMHGIEVNAGPIRDPAGRIGGVLVSLHDLHSGAGALQLAMSPMVVDQAQNTAQLSQMLLDQVLECVITTDSQDRIQFANGRALENFGFDLVELRGEHISRLLPEPFLRKAQTRVSDFLITLPGMASANVTARRRDGSEYPATLVVHPVDLRGRQGHVITVRPIAEIADSQELDPQIRKLLSDCADELVVVEPDTQLVIAANQHALRNLGLDPRQLAKTPLAKLCTGRSQAQIIESVRKLRDGSEDMIEYLGSMQRQDGSHYQAQVRLSLLKSDGATLLLHMSRPVDGASSEQSAPRLREDQLEFMAFHDALTGLPSRPLFMDRLKQAQSASERNYQPLAIVALSLSGFPEVNEAHGYEKGDQLLKQVADRLSATVRGADTVARLGGPEFVVLATGLERRQDVKRVLARLQKSLSAPIRIGAGSIAVTACYGITVCSDFTMSGDELMKQAGHALREAHDQGPGHAVLFRPTATPMRRQADAELSPEAQLEEAHARGQLNIELQPIYDVRARLLVGAEVLLAWRYPGRGMLRTAEQIQEASGHAALGRELGRWVFERACEQQSQWRDVELKMPPMLINLSALPLSGRRAAQSLRGILARYRVPAEQFIVMINARELEALLLDDDSWLPIVRDLGFRLGVSDTDASHVGVLRRSDADVVRLTPKSIAGLPNSKESAEQTADVIESAQRVGARLVASGVERAGQREALIALGCYFQQGRLLGEAVTPREFARGLLHAEVGIL